MGPELASHLRSRYLPNLIISQHWYLIYISRWVPNYLYNSECNTKLFCQFVRKNYSHISHQKLKHKLRCIRGIIKTTHHKNSFSLGTAWLHEGHFTYYLYIFKWKIDEINNRIFSFFLENFQYFIMMLVIFYNHII